VYSIDTEKMATFDYLPCLQDIDHTSINYFYVHYSEQIYAYSIVFRNNVNACTFLIE